MWLSILKYVTDNTKDKTKTKSRAKNKYYSGQVVIPNVEEVSERVHRVMKKLRQPCVPTPPSGARLYIDNLT